MRSLRVIVKKILGKDCTYQEKLKNNGFKYGKNFNMEGGCIIDDAHCWLIECGDNVTLAPRVHILAHDASTKKFLGYTRIGKVKIGDNVFIGAGSIVLPGVEIGNNVIVGAGAVVTKDIPSNSVAAGVPAKVIKDINSFLDTEKRNIENGICYDERYKLGAVTDEMKEQMKRDLKETIGYII